MVLRVSTAYSTYVYLCLNFYSIASFACRTSMYWMCNTLNTLQHTASGEWYLVGNILQHTATHCNTLQHVICTRKHLEGHTLQHIANFATHPNTLQHTLANYNRWVWVSQGWYSNHTATHCSVLQCVAVWFEYHKGAYRWVSQGTTLRPIQHTTTHRNTLQHTATHCNNWFTLPHIVTQYTTHHYTLQRTIPDKFYKGTPRGQYTPTHYDTLQQTTIHRHKLQNSETHYHKLHHTATHCNRWVAQGSIWRALHLHVNEVYPGSVHKECVRRIF